jgi:hypothetical protein
MTDPRTTSLKLSSPVAPLTRATGPPRIIIYGDTGVGKTTLALTAPRPFIIDSDGGLEGDAIEAAIASGALVQTPTGYRDMEAIYWWCKANLDKFDSIVIDSLDGLIRLLLNEVVDQGKAKGNSSYRLEVVPEQAEYLTNQKQIERIITDLRRLGKPIIVTSAVRVKEGEKRCIDVAPGLKTIVNRWSSILGELSVLRLDPTTKAKSNDGVPTRVMFIDPSSAVRECKGRWAALGGTVIEPNLGSILTTIEGVNK